MTDDRGILSSEQLWPPLRWKILRNGKVFSDSLKK